MASRTVSIILTGNNAGAVKALAGVETAAQKAGTGAADHMGKSAGKIGVAFHALDQQLSAFGVPFAGTFGLVGSTLEHAENKTKSFGSTLSKIGQVELTAAIVGIAAVGSEAVHLADDLEKAHAREETAIKNAGGSYEEYRGAIEKTKSQMEKFGFTNAETETSLANLTNATHDAGKAIDLQSLAADIARGRNIGLAEATNILMKVETGHVQLLGRLGINVKDANGKIISQEEAIKRLSATYKGQAAAAADTFAGKMKTLSTTVQDVGAKLGENIVPKVEALASGLSTGITKFEAFNSTLDGVPGKVLAITAAAPAAYFALEKLGAGAAYAVSAFAKIGDGVASAVQGFGRFAGVSGEAAAAEGILTEESLGLAAAENAAAASTGVLSGALGGLAAVAAGVVLGKVVGDKINDVLNGAKPNVEGLTKSFGDLAQGNQVAGVAAREFGVDLSGLADDLGKIKGVHIPGTHFDYLRSSARHARTDVAAVNDALKGVLASQGTSAAGAAFQQIRDQLVSLGVPVETINQRFQPFLRTLGDSIPAAASTAKGAVRDLGAEFSTFADSLGKADAGLKVADSFDSISTAAQKVKDDKADLAGTSDKATNANRAEAAANRGLSDSYLGLRNAQDGVASAANSLLDAQRALDQYNSARGIKERSLQLDIIRRRVVSTPAESDQKQLDLLQFDDTNAAKKQQLQDAVIAGQKSLASAEHGVVTATQAVRDAQQGVTDAVKARRAVHDDAAKAIAGDERKVQEAVINTIQLVGTAASKHELTNAEVKTWAGLLDAVTKIYAPGSALSKNIDSFYQNLITNQDKANSGAPGASQQGPSSKAAAFFSQFNGSGVGVLSGATLDRLLLEATGKFVGPISPADKKLLHQLGVPGFAQGGTVPGAVGAPHLAVVHGGERILTVAQAKTVPEQPARHTHQLVAPQASSAADGTTASRTDTSSFQKIETASRSDRSTSSRSLINDQKTSSSLVEKLIDRKTDRAAFHQTVPALAAGGPVDPRKPHLVGEKGPELFVPKVAGTIIPNHRLASAPSATAAAVPRPVVQHTIDAHQENHFHGAQTPTLSELDYLNREQGWRLSRTGRGG